MDRPTIYAFGYKVDYSEWYSSDLRVYSSEPKVYYPEFYSSTHGMYIYKFELYHKQIDLYVHSKEYEPPRKVMDYAKFSTRFPMFAITSPVISTVCPYQMPVISTVF